MRKVICLVAVALLWALPANGAGRRAVVAPAPAPAVAVAPSPAPAVVVAPAVPATPAPPVTTSTPCKDASGQLIPHGGKTCRVCGSVGRVQFRKTWTCSIGELGVSPGCSSKDPCNAPARRART